MAGSIPASCCYRNRTGKRTLRACSAWRWLAPNTPRRRNRRGRRPAQVDAPSVPITRSLPPGFHSRSDAEGEIGCNQKGLAVNQPVTRVLVIDDQAHVRATISLALQAKGFQVVGAEDGAEGLNQFGASHFDL